MNSQALSPAALRQYFPKDESGRELIRLSFYFSFQFPDGFHAESRRRAVAVANDYWSLCGSKMKWMTTPLKHQWKQVPAGYSIDQWQSAHPQGDWVWQMLFHSGESKSEAAEFQISGLGNSTQTFAYSHLFLFLPPTWFSEHDDVAANPVSLYRRWAGMIQARHGTAGLGLMPAEDTPTRSRTSAIARAFSNRFPGVELADALGNQNVFWGLLSANWLNLIDATLVEKLGGLRSIQQRLAEEPLGGQVALHPFDGGLILASGPTPQLSEGSAPGIPPQAYAPVARLLRPLRTDRPWGSWGCPKDESMAWLERFDRAAG